MIIAGVDEAGRGALAGPVVAACVILTNDVNLAVLQDSKAMTAKQRDLAYAHLIETTPHISVAVLSHTRIDEVNILQATLLAMAECVHQLAMQPDEVWVDGNKAPAIHPVPVRAIVDGDATVPVISAASIIAKVTRDRLMCELDTTYPEYEFARHKGYGTRIHYTRLAQHGPSPVHRRSFNLSKQLTLF